MGSGIEKPLLSLSDAIVAIDITGRLSQRTKQKEVKEVVSI